MLVSQNELSSQNGQIITALNKIVTDERLQFKHSTGCSEFVLKKSARIKQ